MNIIIKKIVRPVKIKNVNNRGNFESEYPFPFYSKMNSPLYFSQLRLSFYILHHRIGTNLSGMSIVDLFSCLPQHLYPQDVYTDSTHRRISLQPVTQTKISEINFHILA